jgi:hypothetical protein
VRVCGKSDFSERTDSPMTYVFSSIASTCPPSHAACCGLYVCIRDTILLSFLIHMRGELIV